MFKDIDTNGRHFQTLDGGMYFESGIYIELSAFVGVGKKEYGIDKEFKFKLLDAGDKYLYVEPCENEDITIIYNENELNYLDINGLIPAEGKFMDITTGEIETRTIPSSNIKLISNTNLFKVDNNKKQLIPNMDKIDRQLLYGIPNGSISLYYKGPNILFSSAYLNENIPELKGFKELCNVKVVYVPKGMKLEDSTNFGKEVTITYKVQSEEKEEIVKTENIIAGQYYKGEIPFEIISYCRKNGLLSEIDNNAVTYSGFTSGKHIINEDTTFVFNTKEAQRFIAIQYKSQDDFNLDTWTVDIMALNYNELPKLSTFQTYTPNNVYYEYFVVTLDGNKNVLGNEYLSKYDLYMTGTYGYETNKVLKTINGTLQEIEKTFNEMKNNEGSLKEYYKFFTYTLKADYITGMHTVTFYDENGLFGQENVKYGEMFKVPDYWINNINQSTSKRLVGFDIDNDNKADILPSEQFIVKSDMTLKPIMSTLGYSITIIDFDGNESQYIVDAKSEIPSNILNIINKTPENMKTDNKDSFYSDSYWTITASDFVSGNDNYAYFKGVSMRYYGDITIMPSCDIVIKGIRGELYHYVTITDDTKGYFTIKNEDGTTSTATEVKIAVKDGSYVGYSKDYNNIKYVIPKEDEEEGFSNNSIVSDDGELLDIYGTIINEPKVYHMKRFVVKKDSYSIVFEYYVYDKYGNKVYYEKKHEVSNINKVEYEKLCEEYNKEYDYLRSNDFYNENNSQEYEFKSYADGAFDHNSENPPDPHGVVKRYYQVIVQKVLKQYKVTVILNNESYAEQEVVYYYEYGSLFMTPEEDYYKFVEIENEGSHIHYFAGFDTDGDKIANYLPGENFIITNDITLVYLWECSYSVPCGKV